MFYRLWLVMFYLPFLPKARVDTAQKHKMRMEVRGPRRAVWRFSRVAPACCGMCSRQEDPGEQGSSSACTT